MQSPQPSTAIVIGSGIVGAATAYFLTKAGVKVHVLDAVAPAAEASGAADGAVSVASKRPGAMMTAALSGVNLYRELAHEGLLTDLFNARSTFIVAVSDEECAVLDAHSKALSSAGVSVETRAGAALRVLFPALSSSARMAVEVRDEGHAIGYQIVRRLLSTANIEVQRSARVERFIIANGGKRLSGVETATGKIMADVVIVAAGGGSGTLLGIGKALIPRKGQLLVTERAPALNASMPGALMSGRYLLSKGSQTSTGHVSARGFGLVIDPLRTGQFLIGGTRENFGDGTTNDVAAVSQILRDAVQLVPALADIRLLRSFAGVRTAVSDGLPLIGRLPGLENAYVATGFEGDGICLGPVTGKAISQLVCGQEPVIDLAPFNPDRFPDLEVAA